MVGPDYQVQSLARAVALLQAFSAERPSLTLGDLSCHTRLPRSTVHRLVVNLVGLGLLARDPLGDSYRLGLLLTRLGSIALSGLDVRAVARPILERVVRQSGEAAALAALDRSTAVYVDVVESGRRSLSITSRVGDRVPLHSSGTGKCLLACVAPDLARRLLEASGLPRLTARTVTDLETFLAELDRIQSRGYSVDSGESEEGLSSIAAPVWGAGHRLLAAVCVAGPSERILGERRGALVRLVRAAADEISAAVGAELGDRSARAVAMSRSGPTAGHHREEDER